MRKRYSSDISKRQFAKIRPMLEKARKVTKPRTIKLYDIFCAVLYVVKSGCQWRMLPGDFPKWQIVYRYFRIWKDRGKNKTSLLERILKKCVGKVRKRSGRKTCKTSFCIVDSQSVKNTDTAKQKGYDAGKKVSGIKRHIAVDTQGLPHAVHVTTANITDRDGAVAMMNNAKGNLSRVKNVLVDGGYTGEKFAEEVKKEIGASVEVAKRSELHKFAVLPKRWVVERSFGWLEKCRRLWKNCEGNLSTSLQVIVFAFIVLLVKRC